jgi:hypothetical protein
MAVAIEFHDFCSKVLKLPLTEGQRVIAKVAFGDYLPADLEGSERDLAQQMFGGLFPIEENAKRYVCLRLGRGSGKTTMCAAYGVYKAVTHDISKCGPGDVPYIITVAPDKETAKLSIRMTREMIRQQPALERLVVNDTDTMVTIRRPDGRMVRIEAFAATRGGSAIRGRTIITFLLDEAEFFTSNDGTGSRDYSVNDYDIFRALKPRLLMNGKGMLVSTPWPVETLMGKMFEENWGTCKAALSIKAPTVLVRGDDPEVRAMVEDELEKDPENARRELFCELDHYGAGDFFDGYALQTSLDDTYEFPQAYNPKWPVAVGCDFGFTRDSSAIVVVQFDGRYYRIVHFEELRPKPNAPLKPSNVIERFAGIAKRYGVGGVVADGYYREAVAEYLQKHNLAIYDAPGGAKGKAEVFQRAKAVLTEGFCKIPDVQLGRRMVQQAKLVTIKAAPGGTVTVKIPRKIGLGHGDVVSAWVLAVHRLAHAHMAGEKIVYEPGTPEWNAEFQRRVLTKQEKQWAEYVKSMEKQVRRGMNGRRQRLFEA